MAGTEVDAGPRSKRAAILAAAVRSFGKSGYEHTRWSTVADQVGIGQTALYHYFESKAHCLLTIMRMELQLSHERFVAAVADLPPEQALRAAVRVAYGMKRQEVLQLRILHSHVSILAHPRGSVREEEERQGARALVQQIERDWTELLQRGMDEGVFPQRNAKFLGRSVLGMIIGVWDWYRPNGSLTLPQISDMMEAAVVRLLMSPDVHQ
jgi:AcrR family transcriptional regulator